MSEILSTEFGCKSCKHTGHFRQQYQGYRVSDMATCPQCFASFDVSTAKGIEKWNKRLSFTLVNPHAQRKAIFRIGGAIYEVLPTEKVKVAHYGYDLFEYKSTDGVWHPRTSVWYFCYDKDWRSEIEVDLWAMHEHTGNTKSTKKSWW